MTEHGGAIVVTVAIICGCGVGKKEITFHCGLQWLETRKEEEKRKMKRCHWKVLDFDFIQFLIDKQFCEYDN